MEYHHRRAEDRQPTMPLRSGTMLSLAIIEIYMLTLWGGEGTSRLGVVHIESSIVLMVLEVYRVRSRISSVGALPNDIADVVRAKVTQPSEYNLLYCAVPFYFFKNIIFYFEFVCQVI